MEENESVFRKKSLDRVNAPEELDTYLKVTSPSFWIFLVAIIALLIGVVVWSVFGKVEGYVNVGCSIEGGTYSCYYSQDDYERIKDGETLRIDETEVEITSTTSSSISTDKIDPYILTLGNITSDYVFETKGAIDLEDGFYAGKIITETISPITFVID